MSDPKPPDAPGPGAGLRAVAVFCGSLPGRPPCSLSARVPWRPLAARGITLVYGGGRVGLMGAVADGALRGGGRVVGVIPRGLVDRELAHRGPADIRVTTSMHERKATMADLSDAFVALPGGAGTLDELFEAWTLDHPGHPRQAVRAPGCAGFYAGLRQHVEHMVRSGFIDPVQVAGLLVDDDAGRLLDRLAA